MKNIPYIFIIIFLNIFLSGCKSDERIGQNVSDYFYVRNDRVDLPVLVEGNTASHTFVLYVHGGPETGGIAESKDPVFWDALEHNYAVVYYDQRGMGMSNGNFAIEQLSIEQSVDDLDNIITVLRSRYGAEISLFMLGGSWGGFVSAAYLTTGENQQKIKGWIEIGGAHNMKLIQHELPIQISKVAQQQINNNMSSAEWLKFLHFAQGYDANDTSFDKWLELIQQYGSLTGLLEHDGEIKIRKTSVKVPTSVNLITLWANDNINQIGIKLLRKYYQSSFSDQLVSVKIPARFFWGEYDFASPPALAQDAYDHIGTPAEHKQIKIFEHADHTILLTQPDELLESIVEFVELYR